MFNENSNKDLIFVHGNFREEYHLSAEQQNDIRKAVKKYISAVYAVAEFFEDEVIPESPKCHGLKLTDSIEEDALSMRKYLGLSESGPVSNLIELLEHNGIFVYIYNIENDAFSGMSGLVNGHPYLVVNGNTTTERIRFALAYEMSLLAFAWAEDMEEVDIKHRAFAIAEAFLLTAFDMFQKFGGDKPRVLSTKSMISVCQEYGVSMYLLINRMDACGTIMDDDVKEFYAKFDELGWKTDEPSRIEMEEPMYFRELPIRAVVEGKIPMEEASKFMVEPYSFYCNDKFLY